MPHLFLQIINMSISASYIVLAVLLLRLLLKKSPKWVNVFLWGIVALRLVVPFGIESILSLIPSAETISPNIMTDNTPTINTGIPILNSTINPIFSESFTPNPGDSANPLQILVPVLTVIWIIGVLAFVAYTAITYFRLIKKVETSIVLRNNIFQGENVSSPFVIGIIKPKIYLPLNMSDADIDYVIAHETAHIKRKDHLWKPLGFFLLALHWFNPIMWLGYVLLCRDIELACDEKVIKNLENETRADYSEALLSCSVNRRMIAACPLAFGEVGVKKRIKSVLNYKKPTFWIVVVSILVCGLTTVCFLTNPIDVDNIGVKSISTVMVDDYNIDLIFKYSYPTGGYSVRYVSSDEKELNGNGSIDYDGSLGEYRILIKFGDTDVSKELAEKFPVGEVVNIECDEIDIKVKRVHPNDHGFSLYVGFDRPVTITPIENGKLNSIWGKLSITVTHTSYSEFEELNYLRTSYPYFFDLNADNGLTVYIWQLAAKNYSCYLISNDEIEDDNSILTIDYASKPVSISEMRAILSTYNISKDKISITPIRALWSSFYYEINDEYRQFIEMKFWSDINEVEYDIVYDEKSFDIDNDGIVEKCYMSHGFTSGRFSFLFYVYDSEKNEFEYSTTIYSDVYDLSFAEGSDGITRVRASTREEKPKVYFYDISIKDGEVYLEIDGVPIGEFTLS